MCIHSFNMLDFQKPANKRIIEDLRKRLLLRGPEKAEFNEKDLDHVQKDDLYVWLFLQQQGLDLDKALEMMVDCLKWREQFGVCGVGSIPLALSLIQSIWYSLGVARLVYSCYSCGVNIKLWKETLIEDYLKSVSYIQGTKIKMETNYLCFTRHLSKDLSKLTDFCGDAYRDVHVLFHTKLYKKEIYDLEEVKKLFIFGLEKMSTSNLGQKVTLIFNMQDSGLSNMDMDLIKFVITCFQTYFPSMLEYLIVFETPWILTAAWKIVKTWLSTELISKIKFVNKTEILQYIDQDQLLTSMGGTDEFVYKYPPQLFTKKAAVTAESPNMRNKYMTSLLSPNKADVFSSMSISVDASKHIKSRTGADPGGILRNDEEFAVVKHGELSSSSIETSMDGTHIRIKRNDEDISSSRTIRRNRRNQSEGPLVKISPAHELLFCGPTSNTTELLQIISITNTVSSPVAFKVKTTSPESFRVRPSSGPIAPGATVEVHVNLQPGHEASVAKDKFLILSTLILEHDKNELSAMWKTVSKSSIMEQRLRCRFDCSSNHSMESEPDESSDSTKKFPSSHDPLLIISKHLMEFDNKMVSIQKNVTSLERDVRIIFRLLVLLLIIFISLFLVALFSISKEYILYFL